MKLNSLISFIIISTILSCYNPLYTTQKTAEDHLEKDVRFLASDKLEGRETGTEGERMAASYIADRFRSLKLETNGDQDTYLQPFHCKA